MARILYTCYKILFPQKLKEQFEPVHPNTFYHHCTIEFGARQELPNEGENVNLKIVGRLTTNRVDSFQGDKPNPHITLSTAEGVKPAESNIALEENSANIHWFENPFWVATVATTIYNK